MQAYLKPPKKYDQHRSLARSDKMNEKENNNENVDKDNNKKRFVTLIGLTNL